MLGAAKESKSLQKRASERLKDLDDLLAARTLETFDEGAREEAAAVLTRLLRDRVPRDAADLSLAELVETAYDDIVAAAELNHTEDPKGQPYCNAWWCFGEVTSRPEFDYEIFFAEAEHVGYKRTTRHPGGIPQPNDLFQTDADGRALFNSEEQALFSDFTMRLRFSDKINPHFAWYFMRSVMFQSQIEREKRGMGNMTNIFPGQVERLLIVECLRDRQDAVAAEVAAELEKRENALRSIEARRKEIDARIEAAIRDEVMTPSRG